MYDGVVSFVGPHAQNHRHVGERETNQQEYRQEFGDVEKTPWNVAIAAVAASIEVERGENGKKETRRPYQHCVLETKGEVGVGLNPCH